MNLADVIFVEDLIVFIFRIINFAVLLGLLAYGFKQYALPSLRQMYDDYYGYFDHLISCHTRLVEESGDMARAKQKELQEQNRLKERMMQWRAVVDAQLEQKKRQAEKQAIIVNERMAIQQEKIKEYRLKAQVMPLAIVDARKRLVEIATTQPFQRAMIEKTLTLLRKAH